MPQLSLIISFYQKIEYLELVFAGLCQQTFKDYEIIIADDGSEEKIVQQVKALGKSFSLPFHHVWQEDKGFRKNKILNTAINSSNTTYLVFIDGDCIPHPQFLFEHFQNKKEGACLTGRRVDMSETFTKKLTSKKIENGYIQKNLYQLFYESFFWKSFNVEKGLYIKNTFLRKIFNKKRRGILGSNFSLHKKDILAINGFDERYEEYSIGEDTDIQYRLELNGIQIQSVNNMAIQYHLYHKKREPSLKNLELFEEVKKEKKAYTSFGIVKA